jgi:phosphate uptake regulator
MVWKRVFGPDSSRGLDQVRATILEMLANDRHSFDLATSALLMGANADVVGPDLLETDRQVNEATAEVRRQLVVHVGVHGAIEATPVLTFMSIVKDVERVGDYAKNILDLARQGVDLSQDDDQEELSSYRDRVSTLITEASRVFGEGDADRARELNTEADRMLDDFDRHVDAYVQSDEPARVAVPRALYYRYLKRIVAHLMNLLTALTMPLDRLDYFDEDAAAR